jgi:DNA-directed RNA polymerase specialized sigma24 family protein
VTLAASFRFFQEELPMPLRLRFLDEMPLNRIAAFMGVPLSTVKWRIHHGKKLLRAKVELTK